MKKRKLLTFPKVLSDFLEHNNYQFDVKDISSFVTYFYKIYEQEKAKNPDKEVSFTIANIFANIEAYSQLSGVYTRVLGREDARLVKANPGPNSAYKCGKEKRLKTAVDKTLENFQKTTVRIPTFNEILDCGNEKDLRVICGNFTHPSNLTHGERTGACMRIGGVGESLFNFCLENEYGFHIRFEDPNTGEYVSRVSGFRNGNTVFLNQLRFPCTNNYTNRDLEEACKNAADQIIELSKDSECPIENVVISGGYVMSDSNRQFYNLEVENVKQGFEQFYSDVNSYAILLSTTASEGIQKVDLDNSKVPKYLSAREKTRTIYTKEEMLEYIYRIKTIRELLETGVHNPYSENFEDGFAGGIANQDWYVYVDNNKVIHSDIINIDYRAQEELNQAIEQLKTKYNIEVGDKYGL